MSINRSILIGRLTTNPELKTTKNEKSVVNIDIAVPRIGAKENQKDVDFIHLVIWGKSAEFTAEYLTKGRLVAVEGAIRQRSYIGEDKVKRERVEIWVDRIQALDYKKDQDNTQPTLEMGDDEYDPFAEDN